MRLITFNREGQTSVGGWIDNDARVVDLARAARMRGLPADPFDSMLALIEAGPQAWESARSIIASPPGASVVATAECQVLAPLPRPTQIRDCVCFPEHAENGVRLRAERLIAASPEPEKTRAELKAAGQLELAQTYYAFPLYYLSNRMGVVGPDADVRWPRYSSFIDYEMEWAAVIGTQCVDVARENAAQAIFGYTIYNNWAARDEQMRAMQGGAFNVGPGRGKDFCNSFGPCIVTADEIADPYSLFMRVRVNGVQVSEGNTAGMHYKFADLIAFLSQGTTLYPGEILGSGTVGGGCAVETGKMVRPGDLIELEVEQIGTLRNRVIAPYLAA
jgi:2-keto-4-pentenoate hydratase/2-oxohepta-3-ene-1,7-dioic acid hydratase in catechol pathway